MLSILRRQAELLEKELLEARQSLDVLRRKQAEHDAIVNAKDERIKELESELAKRQPLGESILCIACGKSAQGEEEDAAEKGSGDVADIVVNKQEVLDKLEALKKKLLCTESKLTSAELEKSILELQLETKTSRIRRELTRELDGARAAGREAAAMAAKDLRAAQNAEQSALNELAARDVEILELKAGLTRRDEQVQFLMQVHDASQECEWVPVHGACCSPGNTSHNSSSGSPARGAGGSPYAAARHINGSTSSGGFTAMVTASQPWQCKACTLRNAGGRTMCEACGTDR